MRDDLARDFLGLDVATLARGEQPLLHRTGQFYDSHHSTILFRGYSTIPCAFAALSFGKICRTTDSSTMVFTATHSGSLSIEIVGFLSAGRMATRRSRSTPSTFR